MTEEATVEELRQRLEKSEAARQKLREAVTAGLAANAELRRDKEALSAGSQRHQHDLAAAEKRASEFAAVAKRASAALATTEQGRLRAEEALAKERDANTALRSRMAVLESSLAAVREAALGAGTLLCAPPPVRSAGYGEAPGAMQSALSGPDPKRGRVADTPPVHPAAGKRIDAVAEAVVESGEQQARKKRRAATDTVRTAADGPMEQTVAIAPLRRPLPPPVSPLPPPRRVHPAAPQTRPAAPPPRLPPLVAPVAEVHAVEDRAPVVAPPHVAAKKAPVSKQAKQQAAASVQPQPPPPPPSGVELARTGAIPLGQAANRRREAAQDDSSLLAASKRAATQDAVRNLARQAVASNVAMKDVAQGLCAAAAQRSLPPTALLQGMASALRCDGEQAIADDGAAHEAYARLAALVLAIDAELAAAHEKGTRTASVRILGGGSPGGFADAVTAEAHGALLDCVREQSSVAGGVAALARGAIHLLRARRDAVRARVLLLDLLLVGRPAGAVLRDAAAGALLAWPEAYQTDAVDDPLSAAVAAVLGTLLADVPSVLPPSLTGVDADTAVQSIVKGITQQKGEGDHVHSAARGLEVLTRHNSVAWVMQHVVTPHLSQLLQGDDAQSRGAALRALTGPLLATVVVTNDAQSDEANAKALWALVVANLQPGRSECCDHCAAACITEVAARTGAAAPQELQHWWFSLDAQQKRAAPAHLMRALRAVGLA